MAKRSPALISFRVRLEEVNRLLKLCESASSHIKQHARARKKDDALCRAALVLLCSHMEGYFEDLIDSVIEFHGLNQTLVRDLPVQLKVTQILGGVGLFEGQSDSKKWVIIQAIRNQHLTDETLSCNPNSLDSELHTKGFAVPGSREVEKLFRTIGVEDIWGMIEQKRPRSRHLKHELDTVVKRRHPIAHGDVAATVTPEDVKQYVHSMKRLALLFDVIIASFISNSLMVEEPWKLFAE